MADIARGLGVSADAIQRWEARSSLPRAAEAAEYALLLRRLDEYSIDGDGA